MNIAFFLTPKSDVVTLTKDMNLFQAMKVMEEHRYSEVPVINRHGKYAYTISEGDMLWHLKEKGTFDAGALKKIRLKEIRRHHENNAVSINADVESIVAISATQGFVPVVDDENIFIGIVKRNDIIRYCMDRMDIKNLKAI